MSQENSSSNKSNIKVMVTALAVICVILGASLVGVIALYKPSGSSSQLAERDATIVALQENITALNQRISSQVNATSYVQEIAYLEQQLQTLNDTLTTTNDDMSSLEDILNLQTTGTLYDDSFSQNANSTTVVYSDSLIYAGYLSIAATSTASTTYAEVSYTFSGVNFDFNQTIGTSGTAIFPVLPATVNIIIGNVNQTASDTIDAAVTYYY
jgi:hypothetical protein